MKEKRINSCSINIRSDSEEKIIEGYFAVFNQETELFEGYFEKVNASAFKDLVGKDVRALMNHDSNFVLGRTKNNTLELSVDNYGLFGRIKINEYDTEALNLYERVKRGDVNQCSFGFFINKDSTEWRGSNLHVELLDLDLIEVSVVTFPAYETTSVSARDKFDIALKEKINIRKKNLKEKLNDFKSIN